MAMKKGASRTRQAVKQAARNGHRKVGMRSDPDYRPVSYYMKKKTYHKVFAKLHARQDGTNFSRLVEELLTNWLESQRK